MNNEQSAQHTEEWVIENIQRLKQEGNGDTFIFQWLTNQYQNFFRPIIQSEKDKSQHTEKEIVLGIGKPSIATAIAEKLGRESAAGSQVSTPVCKTCEGYRFVNPGLYEKPCPDCNTPVTGQPQEAVIKQSNMKNIPTQLEHPNGLHQRYLVKKLKAGKTVLAHNVTDDRNILTEEYIEVVEPDPEAEYFVLRLDDHGSDPKHIEACRKAVLRYAELIKDHIPQLSTDLIERYGSKEEAVTDEQLQKEAEAWAFDNFKRLKELPYMTDIIAAGYIAGRKHTGQGTPVKEPQECWCGNLDHHLGSPVTEEDTAYIPTLSKGYTCALCRATVPEGVFHDCTLNQK